MVLILLETGTSQLKTAFVYDVPMEFPMKRISFFAIFLLSISVLAQTDSTWDAVPKLLGRPGKLTDGIYKVSFPRTDLHVTISDTTVAPAAGLGSWMAFRKSDESNFVADGDLVLLAAEVNPAISALQSGGMEVTAVHNHLIGEVPQVMYIHFFGRAGLEKLATTLRSALDKTKTPIAPPPPAAPQPLPEKKEIEAIIGKAGTENGSVLAFSFARPHSIVMHHETLTPAMGMATAINFQPSPKGVAATGDFVLRENEVKSVLETLRKNNVLITAVHNHLYDDEPRMVFVHFWAEGKAAEVATALKHALDAAK